MNCAYRMTVYAGASYSPSSTILTPAAGAPHADNFTVATIQGLSGYKPYMQVPVGTSPRVDLNRGSSTRGNYRVVLLDKTTDGTNANRWVTAFLGTSTGLLSIIGRNVLIEESLDGGSTWLTFFVGRVETLNLANPVSVEMLLADSYEALENTIFLDAPRVNYATFTSIVPAGLLSDLSITDDNNTIKGVTPLEVKSVSAGTDSRLVTLSTAAVNRADNFYPVDDNEATSTNAQIGSTTHGTEWGNSPLLARVWVSGTPYDFAVDFLQRPAGTKAVVNSTPPIERLRIQRIQGGAALTVLDNSNPKTLVVYRPTNDAGDKLSPFFLGASPYTIVADILAGKAFQSGSTIPSIAYDSGALATLAAAGNIPAKAMYRIDGSATAKEWLEKNICQPFNLGYTFDPVVSASIAKSQVRVFSTKQPTSTVGLVEILGSDVIADSAKEWTTGQPVLRLNGTYYVETERKLNKASTGTNLNASTETVTARPYITALFPSSDQIVDATYDVVSIDYAGLRAINANASDTQAESTIHGLSSYKYVEGWTRRLMADYLTRRQSGNPNVRLTLLRSTKVNGIKTGDFILVTVSVLPNAASHTRGGQRIFQVVQKNNTGNTCEIFLNDAGVNSYMALPSLGTVTTPSINQLSFSVTTTVDSLIQVQYSVTAPGGSVPSDSSAQWILANVIRVNNTSVTVTLDSIPNGKRAFVRIRAVSPIDGGLQMASNWVTSTGTELDALNKPTSVAISEITLRSARVKWTNTESTYPVQVWAASPAGVPDTAIATLPAGSTTYRLSGLHKNSSTSHTVGIRYSDGIAGTGQFASASFTASGSPGQLNPPAALFIYR